MAKSKKKPGPKPDRVKTDLDWEDAVGRALKKKRPQSGWPSLDSDEKSHSESDSDSKSDA